MVNDTMNRRVVTQKIQFLNRKTIRPRLRPRKRKNRRKRRRRRSRRVGKALNQVIGRDLILIRLAQIQ